MESKGEFAGENVAPANEEIFETPLEARVRIFNRLSNSLAQRLLSLDEDSLLERARRRTGLMDFGDEEFREPLRVLVAALENEAELSPVGRGANGPDTAPHHTSLRPAAADPP